MIRYIVFIFICFVSAVQNLNAQVLSKDYIDYTWVADSFYHKENYAAAVSFYRKICDLSSFIPRFNYYYTACCYAKLNKPDSALLYLEKGAKKGERFNRRNDIDSDKILAPLRKLKRWDTIRTLLYNNTVQFERDPSHNDSLLKVLLDLEVKDQYFRLLETFDSSWRAKSEQYRDSINRGCTINDKEDEAELNKIISKFGWPGLRMVGIKGESAAWLIAQHSDLDTTFQVFCFGKMMEAMLNHYDSQLDNIAYLQDRILVNRGKEQIYGTQFRRKMTARGEKLVPKPIVDEKNVNKRRHAMQLPSIEEYLAESEKFYHIK